MAAQLRRAQPLRSASSHTIEDLGRILGLHAAVGARVPIRGYDAERCSRSLMARQAAAARARA